MAEAEIELLEAVSLFAGLTQTQRARIARLVQRRNYSEKHIVVTQGDVSGALFVIVSGYVKAVRTNADGRDTGLSIMGPGEVFGEVALLDGQPRSASAIALTPCEVLVIEPGPFLGLLRELPDIAIELLAVLSRRLRNLTDRAEDVAHLQVEARLAKRIALIAERFGTRQGKHIRVPFKLSQQEIGDLVGAARETANKLLRQWSDSGVLDHDHGHLVVRNMAALRKMTREPD
jgi:CRP/FNR family transcriptional regulator, cyclic AMP receptor protein